MSTNNSPLESLSGYHAFTIKQTSWPFWESWYFSPNKLPDFPEGYALKAYLGQALTDKEGQFVRIECPKESEIIHIANANSPIADKLCTKDYIEGLHCDIDRLETRLDEITKDRDYWQALAMQFHDAVHAEVDRRNAEIERRAKVEI